MNTSDEKVAQNHLGFKQYVDEHGDNRCIQCDHLYTNTGDGVLCDFCSSNHALDCDNDYLETHQ